MFRIATVCTALALFSAPVWAQTPGAKAAYDSGLLKKKAKDLKGAEADFVKATQADREFANGWVELGNVRLKLGKNVPAIEAFQMALAKNPSLTVARYNLAFAYRQNGQHAAAADAYNSYLSANPNDSDAYFGLAESLKAAGRPLEAADAFDAYARVEKRPAADKWRKKAQAEAKKLRAANAAPANASGITPTPAAATASQPAATTAGQTAATQKPVGLSFSQNPTQANAATPAAANTSAASNNTAQPATAPSQGHPASFDTGMKSLRAGRFEEARARLEVARREAPEDFFVLAALAGSHLGLGDGEAAEAIYRDALSRAPASARAALHMGVAEAARLQGNEAAARASCQLALGEKEIPPAVQRACTGR